MQELHLHTCVTGRIYSLESEGIGQLDEQVGGVDLLSWFVQSDGQRGLPCVSTKLNVGSIAHADGAVGHQSIEQLM